MTDVAPPSQDPRAILRSRGYLAILVLAALLGIPISVFAYGFLRLVTWLQAWLYGSFPHDLGFTQPPAWWPLPLLVAAGLLVSLAITQLPGTGGHEPTGGLSVGGSPALDELPGIVLAALATLALGGVLGPEAPLIAVGGGLGALAVRLAKKDAPPMAATVLAATGSFAAVATLFGSPLLSAFLLMEVVGLGASMIGVVMVPGLLAAGVGSLVFIGMNSLTGWGLQSLAVPGLPHFDHPRAEMFLYAVAFGLLAPLLGLLIQLPAGWLSGQVQRRRVLLTPICGLGVGLAALAFTEVTHHPANLVLFSGEAAMGQVLAHPASWTVGTLVLLVVAKSLAYSLSLASFRGGPVFPALFLGTVAGLAASHLPGLSLVPAIGMGIGAMAVVMLRLPLSATLLPTLILSADGSGTIPLVIVAVVVAYVTSAYLPTTFNELFHRATPASDSSAPAESAPA